MFDYKAAVTKLRTLHEATLPLPGYFKEDVLRFIEVGEYGLALDTMQARFSITTFACRRVCSQRLRSLQPK